MCITTWGAFLKCKERYKIEKKKEPIIPGLINLFKVKETVPMLAFWCVGCILFQIIMASRLYYFYFVSCFHPGNA